MASRLTPIRGRVTAFLLHKRTRKIALWLVVIIGGYGILLGLIAPTLLRSRIASVLSTKLHREVSIQQLKINPYKLTVALGGLLMKERQGASSAFSFDELLVDLHAKSILRLAPVIAELRLTRPYLSIVRNNDGKYNFQDLIDELTSGPTEPPGPPPRFALHNIQIIDATIDFDDQPEKTRHAITSLKIGIPFISSLPADAEIKIKPELSATVNGAAFQFGGDSTTPFKDSLESSLGIEINQLEIAKYLAYSPVPLNFSVSSGQIQGKIHAIFRTVKKKPATLSLTGDLTLSNLILDQSGGTPLLRLPELAVAIDPFQVFARRLVVKSIKSRGLELHVTRARDGSLNLGKLLAAPVGPDAAEAKPTPKPKQDGEPFNYAINEIALGEAKIHFTDEQPPEPYKTRLENLTVNVSGLSNEAGKKADVQISFETAAKETFAHAGVVQLTPLLLEGKLDIVGLNPGALKPYYQDVLAADIKDGLVDVSTRYSFAAKSEQSDIKLTDLNATLRRLRLELAEQPEPLWRIDSFGIKNGFVDIGKKTIIIGAIESKNGVGYVQRTKDGALNQARIVKPRTTKSPAPETTNKDEGAWQFVAKQIRLDGISVRFDDRGTAQPVSLRLSNLTLRGENVSNTENRAGQISFQTSINDKGALRLAGPLTLVPFNAKLAVQGEEIALLPFQPYLEDQVNFLLTGGRAGTKGELIIDTSATSLQVNYGGGLQVNDFEILTKANSQDLLKWKTLTLGAIQYSREPFQLRVGELTLADFYSRLILGADGKFNLQNLTAQKEKRETSDASPEKPEDKSAGPQPATSGAEKAISIGKINLRGGNIQFSDFFIKPNYSANLTAVQGTISEIKPGAPGNLDLRARLDGAAPVEIKGKINPLAQELFLDLVADAKEIELTPMTPYSVKYVGYGIDKGKLSFNVKYKLDNRKLDAENKIILNQLTFGDKVESPDATNLPVRLAVALLKDRNGVIDIDLPISGSLDDPQFSIGGIVLRLVFGIISKAVTAPFSLLAAAFGGGSDSPSGDELSYIEFASGRASISETGQAKIATLAKALYNRPALNLELIGRIDPASDLEGLKRVAFERKVKAQKLKDLVRRGESPQSLDEIQLDPKEYAQYLKAAYGEENFPKPRNVIGLAQDLPVPEMEKLMLQHVTVSDDDLRQLAAQRAQAVRDALLGAGQIGAERLSIAAGNPLTSEEAEKLKGKLKRVEFTMK